MSLPPKPVASDKSFASPYDSLNRQIVAILQEDGRTPFSAIAEMLSVSEGTVRNRVSWMKGAGHLTIAAIVDPTSISYRADAMLGIKVAPGHTPEDVAARLGACASVVYIMWVSGRYDLLVEVVFDDEDGLAAFMNAYCYGDAGIASVEIMTGIKMFKNQFLLKRDFPDGSPANAAQDAAE
jgi:Lrp/AsnC family transcriptional regulator for asnA, asnC and gidA